MKKKLFLILMTVSLTIGSWGTSLNLADASTTSQKAQEGKQKLKDIKAQQNSSKALIDKVEKDIENAQKQVHQIEAQMGDLEEQIGKLNVSIRESQKELDAKQQQLGAKLRRIYLQGGDAYLAQLLSSESFGQFLERFEIVRLILKQDYSLFNSYLDAKKKLERQQNDLLAKKKQLDAQMAEAKKIVDQYENELEQHKSDLEKLQQQEKVILKQYAGYFRGGGGRLGFPTTPGIVYWNYMQWRGDHYHKGVDFPRPKGTPIFAAEDGVVTAVSTSDPDGYGVFITIDHGNGLQTLYAHMFLYTVTVHPGEHVTRGQKIAEVGNNGRYLGATGYHLHFEVKVNGSNVNPKKYLQ